MSEKRDRLCREAAKLHEEKDTYARLIADIVAGLADNSTLLPDFCESYRDRRTRYDAVQAELTAQLEKENAR